MKVGELSQGSSKLYSSEIMRGQERKRGREVGEGREGGREQEREKSERPRN